ncbi:hypothetical protein CEUSTIGMA_g6587.t1 [Chlamydomonas eustigma]|uniref:Uncharacterized protein n=1 Tax=Chlamydomonas eustigma TaxID=1157962 RepID=A0A250X7V0_9CHLO|nr:hypothetical protein CEUSTIGMA_g6587.t1 [Chlamydomonas eustigma]|eukprot:GAX79147.1 hypothetical protein CEUSTIGMA_g6587.t1 [Chlamydomonas eustigma]
MLRPAVQRFGTADSLQRLDPVRYFRKRRCSFKVLRAEAWSNAHDTASNSMLRRAYSVVVGAIGISGFLICALPSVLSTRLGLFTALACVNTMTPGTVEVSEMKASWFGPLHVKGVTIKDRGSRGGGTLISIEDVTCSSGLWGMAAASGYIPGGSSHDSSQAQCVPMIISKATISCQYDPLIQDWMLMDWFKAAGMINGTPSADVNRDHAGMGSAATALDQKESIAELYDIPDAEKELQPQHIVVVVADGLTQGRQSSSSTAVIHDRTPLNAVDKELKKGYVIEMLSKADSSMGMSMDVRFGPQLQLLVPEAKLLVPSEVRDVVGDHLHISGALGWSALTDWAAGVGEDTEWTGRGGQAGENSEQTHGHAIDNQGLTTPPRSIPSSAQGYEPGILEAHSDHVTASMRFWSHAPGSGSVLLHGPATLHMEFTPALSRLGLTAINPLLNSAIAVRTAQPLSSGLDQSEGVAATQPLSVDGSPNIEVQMFPEGMKLPYTGGIAVIAPMTFTLAEGSLLSSVLQGFDLNSMQKRPNSKMLDVRVSAMQIKHVLEGPNIITNKVDMSVGGVDLCIWGTHHLASAKIEMVIGMPACTLARLGLKELPHNYVLPCTMHGTSKRPKIDYGSALRRLARLYMRQQYLSTAVEQIQSAGEEDRQASKMRNNFLRVIKQYLVHTIYTDNFELINEIEHEMQRDVQNVPGSWSLPGIRGDGS